MNTATATTGIYSTTTTTVSEVESLLSKVAMGDEVASAALGDLLEQASISDAPKGVTYMAIFEPTYVRQGVKKGGERVRDSFAVIDTKKKTIRIVGIWPSVHGPVAYDRGFAVGDRAEYHSYNLRYSKPIEAISASAVSFYSDHHTTRLKISEFARRNRDFDLAQEREHNARESQCI